MVRRSSLGNKPPLGFMVPSGASFQLVSPAASAYRRHAGIFFMTTTKQTSKRSSKSKIELAFMRLLVAVLRTALLVVVIAGTAQAEPRERHSLRMRNYILRRQQVMPGLGTPRLRLINGRREIDIYRNGLMFERDHVVGVSRR
jgi:hypothetical protein